MSNIGTKTQQPPGKWKEPKSARASDRKCPPSHQLPCSISRTLIPTSTAQYTGFFIFIDLMTEALLSTGRKISLGLGENPEKSFFFKLPLRLCECTASTNARSAPQSPPPPGALLAAGLRKAHRERKQRFRLTRYSLSVSSWTRSPQTGSDAFNV